MVFVCRELIRGYNEFLFVLFLLSAFHVELNFLPGGGGGGGTRRKIW